MIVHEALQKVQFILIPENPRPVEQTAAQELQSTILPNCQVSSGQSIAGGEGVFKIAVAQNASFPIDEISRNAPAEKHWAFFKMGHNGSGELIVSHPALLYSYAVKLIEDWSKLSVAVFETGKYYTTAFRWHRPLFDYLLTQTWRSARNFDCEEHIKGMARAGYTHIEVNGMAALQPLEDAAAGEFYSPFYGYCLALDQYVSSGLNQGIYPIETLNANLALLKKYATLGRKYGLEPGILCFEPRSVPEPFFQKYPTLRGARVDHPYRSRLPRYSMTLAHPLVQQHYRKMMTKILHEVPDLAYLSIWSNDSGAGFEFTNSLYVGRNGGPFIVREWRTHEQIAEAAGKNIADFMKLLREAAAKVNPDFRVSLRLEPFKDEHDMILNNLESHLDIEVPSLLVRGYDLPYRHEKYSDISGIAGSIHHTKMDQKENELINKHKRRKITSHLIYSHGNGFNLEPLLGIPFPGLIYEKLQTLKKSGVEHAANLGGFTPKSLVPYHINQEVFRAFMQDPNCFLDEVVRQKATEWAGEESAENLISIWQQTEDAIRWLPPLPLYSHFGFVWLRIWVRPIISDLHAIPDQDRRYYEDFMVGSDNNTNLVDFRRDVLFELFTNEYGEKFVKRIDQNVLGRLNCAIKNAALHSQNDLLNHKAVEVFQDQRDRLIALKCWITTLRSVAAWVAGVYGYLETSDKGVKKKWRTNLDEMMKIEIQNCKNLMELWNNSTIDFMVVSKSGETSFIYGENFGELLQQKIELMEKYKHVEPRIDKQIMWKV